MRLHAVVLPALGPDPLPNPGDNPVVPILSANTTEILDGIGGFTFTVPLTDQRALALLVLNRIVELYVDDGNSVRFLVGGQITSLTRLISNNVPLLQIEAADVLERMRRKSALFNRAYNAVPFNDIVTDITAASFVNRSCAITTPVTIRFDGSNMLRALKQLCDTFGYHFRPTSSNSITVGTLGTLANITAVGAERVTPELLDNPDVVIIQSLRAVSHAAAVATRVYPIGGGQNVDAALTLATSTRTTPYPIQSVVSGGRTVYYLQDDAWIGSATWDSIEQIVQFKQIAPLENTDAAIITAANTLYDAAAAYLARAARPRQQYSIELLKYVGQTTPQIVVGNRLRVVYQGAADSPNGVVQYIDIDEDLWITRIEQTVNADGYTLRLELSNNDSQLRDAGASLIESLGQATAQGTNIQSSFSHFTYGPDQFFFASPTAVTSTLPISNACQSIYRVLLRLRTWPGIGGSSRPAGISVVVNGTSVASGLGTTIADLDTTLDISIPIRNRVGGIRGIHTITLTPTSGAGELSAAYDVFEIIAPQQL